MEERDWRLLHVLYEERNITRTAQRLYISQPAVTYRIQQIEREFGVPIVLRRKTGVEFTAEGRTIAAYASKMLKQLQRLRDELANHTGTINGELRLGVSSTYAYYELPRLLKRFLKVYPHVDITVRTGWSSDILQSLVRQDVHVGIIRGEHPWSELRWIIRTEHLYVVARAAVDVDKLPERPRINYKTDQQLKTVIDSWWNQTYKGQQPWITMEIDNLETCKALVKEDLGYAIVPGVCLDDAPELWRHPLLDVNGQPIRRDTWMFCHHEDLELSVVRAFVEFVATQTVAT